MGAFFFGKDENMTVQKLYVKNKYIGDGNNTVFPITFEWAKKHPESIQVWIRNSAGALGKTDNFMLKTSSNEDIWDVVYPSVGEPLGKGESIIIVRELPLLQVLNLVNQGPYFADDIEITFDEIVMMIQQLNERLARSFKVAVDIDGENTFDTTVPIEPGKTFRVKDDGTGFEVTEDPGQVLPLAKAELEALVREHAEAVKDLTDIKDEAETAKTDAQNAANGAITSAANAQQSEADTEALATEINNKWDTILKKTDSWVTPQMFGAKGNGVNDDTSAILEAFTHKNVFIPSGTYRCTGCIKYLDGQTVIGENRETTIINLENKGNAFISSCVAANTPAIQNFRMEHITLKFTNVGRTAIPIRFNNSYRLYIRHCSFKGDAAEGQTYSIVDIHRDFTTYSRGNTWANRFEDNYFYHCRVIINQNTDSWFVNNDINAIGEPFALELETADGTLVEGNQFIGALRIGRNVSITINNNYYDGYYRHDTNIKWNAINIDGALLQSIISGNRFMETPGHGIYATNAAYVNAVTITSNSFQNCDIFAEGKEDINLFNAVQTISVTIGDNVGTRDRYYTVDGTKYTRSSATTESKVPMLKLKEENLDRTTPITVVSNNSIMWGSVGYTTSDLTHCMSSCNSPINMFKSALMLLGEATGANTIVYDSATLKIKQLTLVVTITGVGSIPMTITPETMNGNFIRNGWYASASDYGSIRLYATNGTVKMSEIKVNGTDRLSTSTLKVYAAY